MYTYIGAVTSVVTASAANDQQHPNTGMYK